MKGRRREFEAFEKLNDNLKFCYWLFIPIFVIYQLNTVENGEITIGNWAETFIVVGLVSTFFCFWFLGFYFAKRITLLLLKKVDSKFKNKHDEAEKKTFGFSAQPNKGGYFLVIPSFVEEGKIYCTDISGFGGTSELSGGGVFFKSLGNECYCSVAFNFCQSYVDHMNKKAE